MERQLCLLLVRLLLVAVEDPATALFVAAHKGQVTWKWSSCCSRVAAGGNKNAAKEGGVTVTALFVAAQKALRKVVRLRPD